MADVQIVAVQATAYSQTANGYNSRRHSVLGAVGRIWVVYHHLTTGVVTAYYSDNNGATWASEIVLTPTTPTSIIYWQIVTAKAASGNIIVGVKCSTSVGDRWRFFERTAVNTWTAKTALDDGQTPSITANNRSHLFQHPANANYWMLVTEVPGTSSRGRVVYFRSTDGMATWGAEVTVHQVAAGNGQATDKSGWAPVMHTDGTIHVIHNIKDAFNDSGIGYTKITAWDTTAVVTRQADVVSSGNLGLNHITVALESGGANLHFLGLTLSLVKYYSFNGTTWTGPVTVHNAAAASPTLFVDAANKPWFLINGTGISGTNTTKLRPWYYTKATGSWVATLLQDLAFDQLDLAVIVGLTGYHYSRHYNSGLWSNKSADFTTAAVVAGSAGHTAMLRGLNRGNLRGVR